ncbi:hypothetical protein L596_008947 [Steinernema carpocapsae]|uniref:Peptidase C1A papain C-terminal domain-containing protein n=1 Tax=Steinernema carpocapsae TaxID=34508 RepID=A0A4U5PE44_STECR|nr:hypothetical protein L596_008947 [Steinernema carpocapsae]
MFKTRLMDPEVLAEFPPCNVTFAHKFLYQLRAALPDSFDWRDHHTVTEETAAAAGRSPQKQRRQDRNLVSVSQQELVDCSTAYNKGCGGGVPIYAIREIQHLGGFEYERTYKYEGKDEFPLQLDSSRGLSQQRRAAGEERR